MLLTWRGIADELKQHRTQFAAGQFYRAAGGDRCRAGALAVAADGGRGVVAPSGQDGRGHRRMVSAGVARPGAVHRRGAAADARVAADRDSAQRLAGPHLLADGEGGGVSHPGAHAVTGCRVSPCRNSRPWAPGG